jgi:mono/diheme cytochrome c family protein
MRVLAIFGLVLLALAACTPASGTAETLPQGDGSRGAQLFTQSVNGAPTCSSCHTLDGTVLVGPSLQGFAERAATRIANTSAMEYAYSSIVQPAAYTVSGFGNSMYNQYAQRLSPQEIADLITYLLTL